MRAVSFARQVTGKLEVTNGGGGAIVHHANVAGAFVIEEQVQLAASYGVSSLQLLCTHNNHGKTACSKVASVQMPADNEIPDGEVEETLAWACSLGVCTITASGGTPGTLFVVRKMA